MIILTNTSGKKIRLSVSSIVQYYEWPTDDGMFTNINLLGEHYLIVKETVEQLDKSLRSSYFEIKEVL